MITSKTQQLFSLFIHITLTYLYDVDPLKPQFYIVKLRFPGVYIIFVISAQKQIVSTHQNRLAEAILMSTHNLYFEQKYEKYLKIFIFWW